MDVAETEALESDECLGSAEVCNDNEEDYTEARGDSAQSGSSENVASTSAGLTGSSWERWVPGNGGLEEYVRCPKDFVAVGVGATVYQSNVTYLKLKCRQVDENGRLTDYFIEKYSGSGSHLEKYWEVPDGHVIRGLGWNVYNNNVNRLNVWHGLWNPSTMMVQGLTCHTEGSGSCENNEVVYVGDDPYLDPLSAVIQGVGLNAYHSNMNRMRLDYAKITKN